MLHIPAKHVWGSIFQESTKTEEIESLYSLALDGINVVWDIPCTNTEDNNISECSPGRREECPAATPSVLPSSSQRVCFRGVHDHVIKARQVFGIFRLAEKLISLGGDHFDIYNDTGLLDMWAPNVLKNLEALLSKNYELFNLSPVAFRIYTAGPMDGHGVDSYVPSVEFYEPSAYKTLNRTVSFFACWVGNIFALLTLNVFVKRVRTTWIGLKNANDGMNLLSIPCHGHFEGNL